MECHSHTKIKTQKTGVNSGIKNPILKLKKRTFKRKGTKEHLNGIVLVFFVFDLCDCYDAQIKPWDVIRILKLKHKKLKKTVNKKSLIRWSNE